MFNNREGRLRFEVVFSVNIIRTSVMMGVATLVQSDFCMYTITIWYAVKLFTYLVQKVCLKVKTRGIPSSLELQVWYID